MSSKIKVDTIENVAGSGNVSLGSGHNLVVPGNITGQGTAAITSNATVGGTLGVTGATTMSGTLTINTASNSLPSISLQHSNSSADNFQLVSGTPGVANSGFSIRDIDAAVNRLVINSAGNIGIGTSAPLRQLHINNTSANSEIAFTAATNGVSSLLFGDGLTGTDVYRGYVQYNHTNENMLFGIAATQLLSINHAANTFGLDFITHSAPYGMRVRANGSYSHQEGLYLANHANTLKWKANMDGSTNQAGVANATSFNATSDYRLKENIEDLTDGITKVKQLQPRKFNWISDKTNTLEDGFIAHEVATVVPSVVKGSKDGVVVWQKGEELPDGVSLGDNKLDDDGKTIPEYQGIEYGKLVPLLTTALQEAIAKIETLETKVAALEG